MHFIAFKDIWPAIMNAWGSQMHRVVLGVAEMASVGFGMRADELPELTKNGPHLLAPTGSDLDKYGELGNIFAGK
jgi:hypothetical protein